MLVDIPSNFTPIQNNILASSEYYYIRELNFNTTDDEFLFNFYINNKLDEEQLGIATLDFADISLFPYSANKLAIESNIWFNHIYGFEVEKMELGRYPKVERFVRLVMLAQYYLQNKKFRDPIFAYRCIYTDKYVVHPGHGRMYINRMFNSNKKDDFIVFYTPNFKVNKETNKVKFKETFNSWAQIRNTFNNSDTNLQLYTGNQTIIPQLYVTQSIQGYREEVLTFLDRLAIFFKTTKFIANYDLTNYGYSVENTKVDREITITVNNPKDLEMCNKSFILASLGKDYNDENIAIKVN